MDGLLYKVGLRQGKEGAPAATAAATHRHRPSQTAGSKKRNSNQGHHRHQGSFNNDAHAHRRTLSSMTTNTSGMAPSQPHHTHHQGSRSRTILTSRLWRRSIFLICCSLLAWAVYQQRFASTSSSSSTSTSLAFAQGAAGSKKVSWIWQGRCTRPLMNKPGHALTAPQLRSSHLTRCTFRHTPFSVPLSPLRRTIDR